MNRREEATHLRSALRQLDQSGKRRLITRLRDQAMPHVEPLRQRIERPLSSHIAAAYRAKGISLEWNLSRADDAAEFRRLVKADAEATPLQVAAVELIFICTRALEHEQVTEQATDWILEAYRALDDSEVAASKRLSEAQREKATLSRGKGDDGRTMADLVAELARLHPDTPPRHVWPHLKSSIEEWAGHCEEIIVNKMKSYRDPFHDGERTISYKHFTELLREAKKAD